MEISVANGENVRNMLRVNTFPQSKLSITDSTLLDGETIIR